MNDWKKTTDDFTRFINDTASSLVKLVNDGAKSAAGYASTTRQKLELKSQIGEHTRTLNKSYARLGEAYYEAARTGKPVEGMEDVFNLIKSNRELIQLLNEKLSALEQTKDQPAAEETAPETAAEPVTDTAKAESDAEDSNEIHID